MTRFVKEVAVVVLALLTLASATWGQGPPPPLNPVLPDVRPHWVAVPNARGVEYAPNLTSDIFRHEGRYFYYHRNAWHQGASAVGPWQPVTALPQVFYRIEAPYFKTPPGWARGKKTGWRGAPLPPGQMKKFEGGHLPPGQMKKYNP